MPTARVRSTSRFTLGMTIMASEDAGALPIGTVLSNDEETWEKTASNFWVDADEDPATDVDVARYGFEITSLPDTPETLRQFQRRFVQAVNAAATSHAVNRHHIDRAFADLDVAGISGPVVGEEYRSGAISTGSVIQVGDESDWSTYGLFIIDAYCNPSRVMGGVPSFRTGTVLRVGLHGYDRPDENDTDDPAAIREWKIRAYKMSRRVKTDTGWCGVLEQTMRAVGITDSLLLPTPDAQYVTREEAALLPVGSILGWIKDAREDCFQYFIRDAATNNAAGTRRIFGQRPDGIPLRHAMGRMFVVWNPDSEEPMHVPLNRRYAWDLLPTGAVFSIHPQPNNESSGMYVMHHNHRATPLGHAADVNTSGIYEQAAFDSYPNIYLRRLP